MSESVGSYMQKGKERALKALVTLAGIFVYIAGVVYAEVHGYSLLSRGVDPDMMLWATVGIVALGITALALPVGLHYSFHDPMQRIAAFAFYAVDLGLLILNAVLDFNTRTGSDLPGWLIGYLVFVVPANPIISACGWSLLTLLDPAQKERGMIEALKASTRQALALRVAEQAKNTDITDQVEQAAAEVARNIIYETLGSSRASVRQAALPAGMITAAAAEDDSEPKKNGRRRVLVMNPARRRPDISYNATAPSLGELSEPVNPTRPGSPAGKD